MRRVFYPSGPSDVIVGFLSFGLAAGLVGVCVYGISRGHGTGGLAWGLIKVVPFVFLGLSQMLYRQRVVLDLRRRTVTAEKWFFLVPVTRESFPVSRVLSVGWRLQDSGWELALVRDDGTSYLLAKAKHPDEALEKELQRQLS